jgi:N-acylneuraminate cytidylyltransferase
VNTIALIPARGGSKGIPGKNIRPLCGKPLIGWTIEAALKSKYVDRVVVSTDDPGIANAASSFGADVVIRPAEISGDMASSEAALLHTLTYIEREEGYRPEIIVFLQCTSPLTIHEDIDGTVEALLSEHADSALAVTPFHYFLWRKNEHGKSIEINHDKRKRPLRQDRDLQFLETGAVYVMKAEGFIRAKHRFFGKTAMYVMPPERSLEIDEPIDLKIAEVFLREQMQKDKFSLLPNPVAALVLDFDGVFTDNRVVVAQDGKEAVVCDRSDGLGISQLKRKGLPILVISTEKNPVIEARCRKLSLSFQQDLINKAEALRKYLDSEVIDAKEVVYLGNDVNDLECMRMVRCAVAVADAHPAVLAEADIILERPGGSGAIRELSDMILLRMDEGQKK